MKFVVSNRGRVIHICGLLLTLATLQTSSISRAHETIISDATVPLSLTTQPVDSTTSKTLISTQSQTDTTVNPVNNGETSPTSASSQPEVAATTTSVASSSSNSHDEQPMTSTVDSMGVNLDESPASTIVSGIEEPSTSTSSATPKDETNAKVILIETEQPSTTTTTTDPEEGPSVESKSLPHEDISTDQKPTTSRRFPKRLNLTQIDQIYTSSYKSEPEVVKSWQEMGRKMKRGVGSVISSMIPMGLNMSQEARIGSNCTGAMLKWVLSMNSLKLWALKMLDASGKPIAGLLEGSMTMFGNHRQCLKVRAPDDDEIEFTGRFQEFFRGKYCIIQAKPWLPDKNRFYNFNTKIKALMENNEEYAWYEKTAIDEMTEWALAFNFVNIRFDMCVPSLCSREDIQKAINFITDGLDMKIRVLRCETEATVGPHRTRIESSDPSISTEGSLGSLGATSGSSYISNGWFLAPILVVGLVVLATLLSITLDNEDQDKTNKLRYTIRSLSLKRSVSSLLNVDYGLLADDKPLALYGIRFILVLWVIVVESAVNLRFEFLRELLVLKDLIFWWPFQFIINSTLQYDSFILLAAFTMAYKNCLNESVSNARAFMKYILDKYIRLMPSVMLMVAFMILLPRLYSGPVWNDLVLRQAHICQSNGWINSMFLQNYLSYKEICLPHTWLLCVEFQLVVLMAPIVYYLNKSYMSNLDRQAASSSSNSSKSNSIEQVSHSYKVHMEKSDNFGRLSAANDANRGFYWLFTLPGMVLATCVVFGWLASFYSVYWNQLPPMWFYTMPDPDSKSLYFTDHLTKLWAHLAVFALGIIGGLECRRANRNAIRLSSGRAPHFAGLKHHKSYSTSSSSSLSPVDKLKRASAAGSSSSSSSISINISAHSHNSSETINRIGVGGINNGGSINIGAGRGGGFCATMKHILCCLLAITTMTLIIFSTHNWSINDLPDPLVAGLFDASSRLLWSLALLWLFYTVSVPSTAAKQLPLIARLLGAPIMVSLGKLSFLIYIIYPLVHMTVLAIQEQPIYSSWLMLFHIMTGNVTLTILLASMVSVFIEMPCRNLFRRCETSLLLAHSTLSSTATTTTTTTTMAHHGASASTTSGGSG